jgi:Protein of unknown function (DUF2795)
MTQGAPSPAKIAQCLKGVDFPVEKEDLVMHAEEHAAEPAVIEALQRLPSGPYDNMADVANAIRHLS